MTTQEPTTGGLPGTTGGALPSDRDLPGTETRPEDPRPGDRTTAAPRIGGGLRSPRSIEASRMLAARGLADHLGGGPRAEAIALAAVVRAEEEILDA